MKQTEHTVKTKLQCLWHLINQLTSPSNIGCMKGEKVMIRDVQLQINHDDARFVATTKTKYTHSRTNHILLITPNKSNDLYYQPHECGKKATIRYVQFVRGPGWNDPMTAVVPRVKGFACYSLSFSRHNKNIKMEHFFLYILSRYFI